MGRRLLALGMKGNRLDLLEAQELPWSMGEPEWCSPLAAGPDGLLVLARRELHRRSLGGGASGAATTPWLSLYRHRLGAGASPQALGLPPVETQLGARPVALSPSGRWLAVRHDALAVRLWPLSPTVPTR
ncbi:MAG: hypothetical protein KatS3mg124_1101 [Porticoccaceae bacterium]|nr:MAG: hypothetical protein KatS3mg124_1101 [Porticoccaceae bacterium]